MNRNRLADYASRHRLYFALFGALVFLLAFLSACQQASEEAVQTAIAETSTAKAEQDSIVDTRVAETVEAQEAATAEAPPDPSTVTPEDTATPTPEPSADESGDDEGCAEDCEQAVKPIVDMTVTKAVQNLVEQMTFEARFGQSMAGGGFSALVEVDVDLVNVRDGPGEGYQWIGQLKRGDRVPVIAKAQNGWLNVNLSLQLGRTGWLSGDYVSFVEGSLQEVPIVATIPPTPRIFPTVTPTPATATPTATLAPDIVFTASRTKLTVGQTSELAWQVKNVQAVYLYPVGADYRDFPVTGEGTRDVRPYITTTYQLRVLRTDGATEYRDIEIDVNAGLTDGIWQLKSYENASGALVSVISGSGVNARFGLFDRVDGSGGCNTYTGDYEAYDETLQIFTISATSAACPGDIMDQESAFFLNMRRVASMTIIANDLTLQDSLGRTILTFGR